MKVKRAISGNFRSAGLTVSVLAILVISVFLGGLASCSQGETEEQQAVADVSDKFLESMKKTNFDATWDLLSSATKKKMEKKGKKQDDFKTSLKESLEDPIRMEELKNTEIKSVSVEGSEGRVVLSYPHKGDKGNIKQRNLYLVKESEGWKINLLKK